MVRPSYSLAWRGEFFVLNEDGKTKQSDALAALQKLMAQSPAAAALQLQLAQVQGAPRTSSPASEAAPAVVGEQYLIFSLAGHQFAVKAEQVQGVERLTELTPLPNVVPWVRGVMNLRGSIVSVVDLRMFLGLEQLPYTPQTRLISLQYNEMLICMVVDGVSEMMPFPPSAIHASGTRQATVPSWVNPYVTGHALVSNRTMVILDVPRLLFSEKMQNYGAL
jgi:purine-binding chemotaxis protein CheW